MKLGKLKEIDIRNVWAHEQYDFSAWLATEENIKELNEELRDGTLTPKSFIQVLRENRPVFGTYRPIIDWYYDDKTTRRDLQPDIFDSEDEIREKLRAIGYEL